MRPAHATRILRPALVASALLFGCSDGGTDPDPPAATVATVELAGAPATLEVGSTAQLTARALDSSGADVTGANIAWETSDAGLASVSTAGLVEGVSDGFVTITASAGGRSSSVRITVLGTGALPAAVTGTVLRRELVVGQGQTVTVSGSTTLWATEVLRVEGRIVLDPGTELFMLSDSAIEITGAVGPASGSTAGSAVVRGTPAGGTGVERPGAGGSRTASSATSFDHGQNVTISGPVIAVGPRIQGLPEIPMIEAEGHVFVAGGPESYQGTRRLGVFGPTQQAMAALGMIVAGDGRDAQSTQEAGQDGHGIFIGDAQALAMASAEHQRRGQGAAVGFDEVVLDGDTFPGPPLETGSGGDGYSIVAIADVVDDGPTWTATATDGGKGGDLVIVASQRIVFAGHSGAFAAGGGNGGSIGSRTPFTQEITPLPIPDGNAPGTAIPKAKSLVGRTGNGGAPGALILTAPTVSVEFGFVAAGSPGRAGGAYVIGGNAGPNGIGGDITLTLGIPSPPADASVMAVSFVPDLVIRNAMRGGDDQMGGIFTGGAGGRLEVLRDPLPANVRELDVLGRFQDLTAIADGGIGFNGCAVNPLQSGTAGGQGGRLSLPGTPEVAPAVTGSFDGGRGGDGTTAGAGGDPGHNENTGNPIGSQGAPGTVCAGLVPAVRLDFAIGAMPAGTVIELSRISGGIVSGVESGCSTEHLHGTIFIDGQGPYADPNPSGCGFGSIIQVAPGGTSDAGGSG